MIIGLTGQNASGKDTVADILKEKGFIYLSLSDVIRDELKADGKDLTRENLINKGSELRKTKGLDYLAEQCAKKIEPNKDYIIVSIRNPAEVKRLKEISGFIFVNIEADARLRFDRMKERGRDGDATTFERFIEHEQMEEKSEDPARQQMNQTIRLAELTIENNGSFDELKSKVEKLVGT